MEKKDIWVLGHKNPDTDSICAAIAYANLKNQIDEPRYIPKRAGNVSAETAYVLNYFGMEAPELVEDVGTQIKDIQIRKTEGVSSHISMKKAWEMMNILNVVTLPVVNQRNQLEGLIVTGDIAKSYMDVYDNSILSKARTQYKNMVETLEGKIVTGNEHGYFVRGKVVIGVGTPEMLANAVESDDLVIIGDREESQLVSIAENCSCMIVTNGFEINHDVIKAAEKREVVIISTPYDTFTTARLINQSMPIKYFMTKEKIVSFEVDDYIDEVRDAVAKIRHRDFPVIDENQNYVGMFSRRNLMNTGRKQVILVDHNEKSQAVENIEEAEILEIIDHHRLGSLETMAPVYFRNQPLGCTSTIIYEMYREKNVEIPKNIAGLLCAAILSDTLMFRSPTCTEVDKVVAKELAQIADIDIGDFAKKMFEAGSDYEHKTEEEILNQDFKVFHAGEVDFGVAQVSAMGASELEKVRIRVESKMSIMMSELKLDMIFVMLTDILEESTHLIYAGEDAASIVSSAFNCAATEHGVMLKGVVSRKKQMIPALINTLTER
ncbi:MAG: putative manganese-dependent inorganic diphosphatase [Agathobacter sp.]|nr:putative manganese-dependent inorganic diphosphatase [Agathobacter sp.]